MNRSIYIHIPFCINICSYCDFSKFYYNSNIADQYLNSLENEINKRYNNDIIDTIYIGGGSPSSLNIKQLNKLFNIIKTFNTTKQTHITFECNSDDLDEEKIKLLSLNNVNRVSIGIQTFNDRLLKILNRKSDFDHIVSTIKLLNDNNINDINVDLMYGINSQTLNELEEDINKFLSLNITHISTYSLILEENTILYNSEYELINEDIDFKMYELINSKLTNNNFNHYETSNYSKKSYESKHNLVYWDNNYYYGFGLSASSYIENKRFTCFNNIRKYINNIYSYEEEIITDQRKEEYEFILGFRKINGININTYKEKFNKDILENQVVIKLLKEKKLLCDNSNLYINPKYIYISNEILLEFIN